ncbi:MAG TPA: poly(R)-hydroxyalkanoic acid synthase subunit PhaE [Ktedonobacterales bacterium]|jgi:polyhydroxyalkanoic acid synthase PhaR subunit
MSEKGTAQGTMDPTRFWKQWQDVTAQMWSGLLEQSKSATSDPFNLYNLWLKNVGEAQAQTWSMAGMLDPREAWKQWFEATSGAWKNVSALGADPLGLTSAWLETLEETRTRVLAGEASPTAAFEFFKQWYEATNESWAKAVGTVFASEQFMEAVKQFLESYAGFSKTMRKANEEYFHGLQLPTRSDIARLGELIVALEEKVDRLDDAFADYKEEATAGSSGEAIAALQKQISQLEASLKPLPHALEGVQSIGGLAKRLEQVERKLEAESLGKRLEQVERKLDAVLSALEKSANKPAPRKSASKPDEPEH